MCEYIYSIKLKEKLLQLKQKNIFNNYKETSLKIINKPPIQINMVINSILNLGKISWINFKSKKMEKQQFVYIFTVPWKHFIDRKSVV